MRDAEAPSCGRRSEATAVWVSDSHKAHEQLGWSATDDLPTGFAALADWLRDHPEHWDRYGIEQEDRPGTKST
jgi:hypothetical protein